MCCGLEVWFLFFNQKTAYEMRISDWSSDVCSSDLIAIGFAGGEARVREVLLVRCVGKNLRLHDQRIAHAIDFLALAMARRVEEIARIHLETRLVRPQLEAAPRCRILAPPPQMLVGGHPAAADHSQVLAAAPDERS